jgi:hypothetical protein
MKDLSDLAGIVGALCTSLLIIWSPIANASPQDLPQGWKIDRSETICSLYRTQQGQFVYLTIRSDGQEGLRFHDHHWKIAGKGNQHLTFGAGATTFELSGWHGKTSNGWNGVIATAKTPVISSLAREANVQITIDTVVLTPVDLTGLNTAFVALNTCAERLTKTTSDVLAASPPILIHELNITQASLPSRPHQTASVGFRLRVDKAGQITACTVTIPGSDAIIDEAICAEVKKQAVFKPALNDKGEPVESTYDRRIKY